MAGSHELALTAEERGIVDAEEHTHRRLIDGYRRKRLGILVVGYGVSDFKTVNSYDRADVPALHAFDLGLPQARKHHQILDSLLLNYVIPLAEAYVHPCLEFPPGYPSDGDSADIRGVLERGNQHLRSSLPDLRSRDCLKNGVKQRSDVRGRLSPVVGHPALLRASIDGLEVQLVIRGVEGAHQVKHLLLHLLRTAVQLIDLVHHDDRLLPHLDGLLKHKTRLRHTALERIDEKQHSVGHVKHTLDLASEIAVPRSVYNIDFHPFVGYGHILCKNCDAPFPFEVIAVKNQFFEVFLSPDQIRLINHPVNKCSLAVVDVRDDCDVSDFHILSAITFGLQRYKNLPNIISSELRERKRRRA